MFDSLPKMDSTVIEIQKKMPLFVFDISRRSDVLQSAEKAIMEECEKNAEPRKSNVPASFVSSYLSHKENQKFSPLIELTEHCVNEISKSHYGYDEKKFKCVNCWGAIYGPGDSARSHHHFPIDFAAVCYLRVDEGAAPIVFEETYALQPKAGSLIVFFRAVDASRAAHEFRKNGGRHEHHHSLQRPIKEALCRRGMRQKMKDRNA